jgi:translocation and assembly module TamB
MASETASAKRGLWWILGTLAALLAVVVAVPAWLIGTESGTRAAFSFLPSLVGNMVRADGIEGRLSGPLHLAHLEVDTEGQRIVLEDVSLDWAPSALLRRELHVMSLHAGNLDVTLKPSKEEKPLTLPDSLALPMTLHLDDVSVEHGSIRNEAVELLAFGKTALNAAYDGSNYRLQLQQLSARPVLSNGSVTASLKGDATFGANKPFTLHASISSGTQAALGTQTLNASGQIKVDGTLSDMRMTSDLAVDEASLTGSAVLRPFSDRILGVASLQAQGVNLAAFQNALPETKLALSLEVKEDGSGNLTVNNPDAGTYDQKKLPVSRLLLGFRQQDTGWSFDNILATLGSAKSGAGELKGQGAIANGDATLTLATQALDLHKLDSRAQTTRLAGHADLRMAAGKKEVTLDLDQPLQKNRLAVSAHATLTDDAAVLDRAVVRLGEGSMEAQASAGLTGTQEFRASGTFSKFRTKDFGNFPNVPDVLLNGSFEAQGARAPTLSANFHFAIHDSKLAGQPLSGEGKGKVQGSMLDIDHLALLAGENKLDVHGRLADDKGNLVFSLHAPKLDQLGYGLAGALDVNGTANGSLIAPRIKADWNGSKLGMTEALQLDSTQGSTTVQVDRHKPLFLDTATLDTTMHGLQSGQRKVADLSLKGQFSPQANAPFDVALRVHDLRAGSADTAARADSIELNVHGTTAAHTLEAALTAPDQTLALSANGDLSRLDKAPQWQGTIQRVDGTGNLAAHLTKPSPLFVSKERVQLDQFRLESVIANLDIEQFVRDMNGVATRGHIERFQVAKALSFASAEPAVSTDLILSGEWDVHFGNTLNGMFKMQRDSGDVMMHGSAPVALQLRVLQVNATATNGQIAMQARLEGERAGRISTDVHTGLVRSGGHFVFSPDAPLSGNIQGDVPSIGWLAALASKGLLAEGSLQTRVNLGGTLTEPDLTGRIDGSKLHFLLASTGIDLRDGVLQGEFHGARLQLNTLHFGPAGSDIVASGNVDFADKKPSATFDIKANKFALFDRSDRRIIVSGSSNIAWSENVARITGEFRTDSGFIDIGNTGMPQLGDDVVIVGKTKSGQGSQRGLPAHIDVGISLGDGIGLTGRGIKAQLGGSIRLASEPGEPMRARGSLEIKEGTYKAYGRELAIERGVLRFNGPIDNPGLDILAMRRGQQVEAGVTVLGTVLAPRVTLVSEPAVSDADKLSWLVLGKSLNDSAGGSGGDAAALQAAAGSLLTQGAASGVQSQIAQAFGLDELKVGTDTESTLQERIVTVGKRISNKLYVSLEQGIENTTSVLKLRYTLSKRLTVEAGAGTRSTVLLFYNLSYD